MRMMPGMQALVLLLVNVALVAPDTQICHDPKENAYSIITCGAPGQNGLPGINGTDGKPGEKGEPGPPGNAGPPGPKGEQGIQGPQGETGDTGPSGPPGNAGPPGPKGEQGIQGPQGGRGDTGPSGPPGNDGPPGPRGEQGIQGPQGGRGDTGPSGPPGAAGPSGPSGEKGPAGLNGATGPSGPRGEKGPAGLNGATGPAGPRGDRGLQGAQGVAGPPGARGEKGAPGPKGETGDSGAPVLEALQFQIAALNTKLRALQASQERQLKAFTYFKGGATSGDKVYITNGAETPYNEAKAICTRAGGQLVQPLNAHENNAITAVRNQFGPNAFLGMTDEKTEGTFRYTNGGSISYANWSPGEPNDDKRREDCIELYNTGKWNDRPCSERRLVICEFS